MSKKSALPRDPGDSPSTSTHSVYLECFYCKFLVKENELKAHTEKQHPGKPICVTGSSSAVEQIISPFDQLFRGSDSTRQKTVRQRTVSSSSLSPIAKKQAICSVTSSPIREDSSQDASDYFTLLLNEFYSAFPKVPLARENQKPPIKALIDGHDIICHLPTAFGKSLIYLVGSYCRYLKAKDEEKPNATVLITPLLSLLADQLSKIREWDLEAFEITQNEEDFPVLENGKHVFLVTSPETTTKRWFRLKLNNMQIHSITVDEVHVVEAWGSFRDSYNSVGELRYFAKSLMACFSATLTETQVQYIQKKLRISAERKVFSTPTTKKNMFLSWKMCQKEEEEDDFVDLRWIIDHVSQKKENSKKIIVFAHTISQCSSIFLHFFSELQKTESSKFVDQFNGLHSKDSKNHILQNFVSNNSNTKVLVSTIAFGMGIDCKGLNIVVHYDKNRKRAGDKADADQQKVDYIQQIGRVGRSGDFSLALRFCPKSVFPLQECIRKSLSSVLQWQNISFETLTIPEVLSKPCDGTCSSCFCEFCTCCSFCIESCKCKRKQDVMYFL